MSDTTRPRLKVSREGVVLIKSFEGFRPRAVQGEDGRWVIGYGHTASAREGATIGEQDAELLLQYDLMAVVKALNESVAQPLNQHQFDALASFAVSVGVDRFLASDVLQRLNEGHAGQAADALIGWPEDVAPDSALRRRAAERALFVADPAAPVHLADLLAAPLPPPPVRAAPELEPEPHPELQAEPAAAIPPEPADARAAAVAALLGEGPGTDAAPVAEPQSEAASGPVAAPTPITFPPAQEWAPQDSAFQAPSSVHLQRYSPYAHAIIGPLAGFPAAPAAGLRPEPRAETEAPAEDGPPPQTAPEAKAFVEPSRTESVAPVPAEPPMEALEPTPVAPLVPPVPGPSPFPDMDAPLVLTPAVEADFADPRPLWTPDQREQPSPQEDDTVLFEEEPQLSVLRHEAEPEGPRRFDWSETGAYLVMGATGLVSCAASAASFRKAMTDTSDLGDFTLIGWVLAVIGAICVGVSGWKLYTRLSQKD